MSDIPRTVRSFNPTALKEARLAAGLSQREAAERAEVKRTNFVGFENGRAEPGLLVLPRLARAVNLHPRDLVHIEDDEITIRDLREWAGLRQREAAAILGYKSITSYQRLEAGNAEISRQLSRKMAKLFGVSVKEIDRAKRG